MSDPATYNGKTEANTVAREHGGDMAGRVVLITGATNGIGKETARAFCHIPVPPTLVLANRDQTAAQALRDELLRERTDLSLRIELLPLDLSSLASVRNCAAQFLALNLPLHVLVLNAGIMVTAFAETADGFERTFQVNHLSHFLLTQLLLKKLIASGTPDRAARVVVVSSLSHLKAEWKPEQLPLRKHNFAKAGMLAYEQSKLCNVLFANELNRRMVEANHPVRANSLHPATMTYSNIGNTSVLVRGFMWAASFFTRSLQQAAATSLCLAVLPSLEGKGGAYYDMCQLQKTGPAVTDANARELWTITEKLLAK